MAQPRTDDPSPIPGVVVIQQNRGLVDYIKDVTRGARGLRQPWRRLASRRRYAAVPDPVPRSKPTSDHAAWATRRPDLFAACLRRCHPFRRARLARFLCAGGGSCWDPR
jgi:dienelactone hydrolase